VKGRRGIDAFCGADPTGKEGWGSPRKERGSHDPLLVIHQKEGFG